MSVSSMLHLHNETNASCPDLEGQGYSASFHSHSSARGPRKKIYHGHLKGEGPRKGEYAVVKVFRNSAGTEDQCDAEIKKHKLARRLAKRFNKMVPNEQYNIDFTLPMKSTIDMVGLPTYFKRHKGRHIDKKEWVLVEENLVKNSDYKVFISKTGEGMTSEPTTLDAFLHFTYNESEGEFVMCGFQGIQTHDGYTLTTPCIHSSSNCFGTSTDRGMSGIRKVFRRHRCNNLCYFFLRPPPSETQDDELEKEEEESEGTTEESNDEHGHDSCCEFEGTGDEVAEEEEEGEREGGICLMGKVKSKHHRSSLQAVGTLTKGKRSSF